LTWWDYAIVALLAAAAAIGALVLTNETWAQRVEERALEREVNAADRFVDVGVTIKVVVQDPAGAELIPGMPRLRVVGAPRHLGGVIDTGAVPPRLVGPSQRWGTGKPGAVPPRVWYLSEAQAEIVLHNFPLTQPDVMGQLVYGSEGAGKTHALAVWHYVRWIEHLGENREGGQTAPTETRLEFVRREMFNLFDPAWYTYRVDDARFVMCDGTRIQLVSTHRQSKAQGSPVQGYNWSWCGRDEGQDQVDVHEDIVNRGRSARRGGELYHQLITATAKDDSDWRSLRDVLVNSGRWVKRGLSIYFSPFVTAKSIADKVVTMDAREVLRRYGRPDGTVDDLPPELAVFYGWDRKRNTAKRPQIATDVTSAILTQYGSYMQRGARFSLVCGHDPGIIYNTTEVAKLIMFGGVPAWLVVGELRTEQTTAQAHAVALKKYLQDTFGIERGGSKAAVFIDPHGKGDSDTDYQTHYMAMQHVGLDAFDPAPMTHMISRSARVQMTNRLLMPAGSEPRLIVALDDHGKPVAPHLVESFETMRKRPGETDPEGVRRKDTKDPTHPTAALGYLLWPFEQEAITAHTQQLALAEARRYQ
jgi:hypothetical protein